MLESNSWIFSNSFSAYCQKFSLKEEINLTWDINIQQKLEIDIKNHPSVHAKLLRILGSCLRYGFWRQKGSHRCERSEGREVNRGEASRKQTTSFY